MNSESQIEAMKAHDQEKVTALNVIINKLMLLTIEKRAAGKELDEADVPIRFRRQKRAYRRKRSVRKGRRTDTVASLEKQLAAIRSYLPS
jgi:uncharacterized protein YqeY